MLIDAIAKNNNVLRKESLKMFVSLIKRSLISLLSCSLKCSSSTFRSKPTSYFLYWVKPHYLQ